jgi:uncharacterized protein YehS (DUF1456 family)
VLRAGETETTQENIQDWLQLDEGDPGFQLLTDEEIAAVIFLLLFSSAPPTLLKFPFICFLIFLSFRTIFCFVDQDYHLIRLKSPPD